MGNSNLQTIYEVCLRLSKNICKPNNLKLELAVTINMKYLRNYLLSSKHTNEMKMTSFLMTFRASMNAESFLQLLPVGAT